MYSAVDGIKKNRHPDICEHGHHFHPVFSYIFATEQSSINLHVIHLPYAHFIRGLLSK